MRHTTIIKKAKWLWLLLLLFSSCNDSKEKWELEAVGRAPYSRMSFVSDSFPKSSLEFLILHEKVSSFITFSALKIVPFCEKKAKVILTIDEKTYEKIGDLYEGNQRLALDESTTQLLVSALQQEKKVIVEVNGYKNPITFHQFSKSFDKLKKKETSRDISSIFNPL
jgi:hypothetical protein